MTTITILGAGAMGSALATPAVQRGHTVRLWGTHLDGPVLETLGRGAPHPGTAVMLPPSVKCFASADLEQALYGADLVIVSVASGGVFDTGRLLKGAIPADVPLLMTSKGFHEASDGRIELLPEALRSGLGEATRPIVSVGGPCKANEVAAGRMTATVFASTSPEHVARAKELLATPTYVIEASNDEVGLEVGAPLKNVYAIALGLAEGLEARDGAPHHNLKAALFARAVREMSLISSHLGGSPETVYGLAGVGDLEVTGLSGRNKVFGMRLGTGESVPEATEAMHHLGLTVEGIAAAPLAVRLTERLGLGASQLPLLSALDALLHREAPAEAALHGALEI
ncbi:MAG: hypothetical protein LBE25_02565 [Arthrobacter sp.]|nr:hypothetical protein [Arthrobacter sp.]